MGKKVDGFWVLFKPKGGKRFSKLPEPFRTRKAADKYMRHRPKGSKYKIDKSKRPIRKGLKIRSR